MSVAKRVAYFKEEAESRIAERLPVETRVALAVERLEILERRVEAIEVETGLDVMDLLAPEDLDAMARQEEILDWVREMRATARTAIETVMGGTPVGDSEVAWPEAPAGL